MKGKGFLSYYSHSCRLPRFLSCATWSLNHGGWTCCVWATSVTPTNWRKDTFLWRRLLDWWGFLILLEFYEKEKFTVSSRWFKLFVYDQEDLRIAHGNFSWSFLSTLSMWCSIDFYWLTWTHSHKSICWLIFASYEAYTFSNMVHHPSKPYASFVVRLFKGLHVCLRSEILMFDAHL